MYGESRGGMMTYFALREDWPIRAAAVWGAITDIADYLKANNPEAPFEYLHCIMPRGERDVRRIDNRNMPWAHYVLDVRERNIVEESGFEEFPFACPRWETASGEVYGRSPGMIALRRCGHFL